jgi:hypothetical protein
MNAAKAEMFDGCSSLPVWATASWPSVGKWLIPVDLDKHRKALLESH